MSYNIIRWKLKELTNLRIPVASFFKHPRSDWHPQKELQDNGALKLTVMEDNWVAGTIQDDVLCVTSIRCQGEGSGTAMNWILEPALQDSTGELVASCVWEGGDTINRLVVKDGAVSWVEIEI